MNRFNAEAKERVFLFLFRQTLKCFLEMYLKNQFTFNTTYFSFGNLVVVFFFLTKCYL